MKSLLLFLYLLPVIAFSQAQMGINLDPKPYPKWTLISFDANVGARKYGELNKAPGVNEYVKEPELLEGQNNTYYDRYYLFNLGRASTTFNANAGFTTGKLRRIVHFGINYTSHNYSVGTAIVDYTNTVVDTFQFVYGDGSSQTILIDSLWTNEESLIMHQKVLSLSADYVLRTARSRLAGYVGIGCQVGVSVNKNIDYSRYQSWRYQYLDTNGVQAFSNQSQNTAAHGAVTDEGNYINGEGGELQAKLLFTAAPFIPIGIEYSPFLYKGKLNRIALELKSKLGSEFNFVRDTQVHIRPFASLTFGVKYFM